MAAWHPPTARYISKFRRLKNNSQVTYQDYPLMIALGAETHGVLGRDVDGENEASPPINESHKMYYGTKTEDELKMLKVFHQ
jgi:hypothetical protein